MSVQDDAEDLAAVLPRQLPGEPPPPGKTRIELIELMGWEYCIGVHKLHTRAQLRKWWDSSHSRQICECVAERRLNDALKQLKENGNKIHSHPNGKFWQDMHGDIEATHDRLLKITLQHITQTRRDIGHLDLIAQNPLHSDEDRESARMSKHIALEALAKRIQALPEDVQHRVEPVLKTKLAKNDLLTEYNRICTPWNY